MARKLQSFSARSSKKRCVGARAHPEKMRSRSRSRSRSPFWKIPLALMADERRSFFCARLKSRKVEGYNLSIFFLMYNQQYSFNVANIEILPCFFTKKTFWMRSRLRSWTWKWSRSRSRSRSLKFCAHYIDYIDGSFFLFLFLIISFN